MSTPTRAAQPATASRACWSTLPQVPVVEVLHPGKALVERMGLSAPAAEALVDLEAAGAIGPFSTSSVRRAFVRAAARLGIHRVRPYDLRHSYGTALYSVAGAPGWSRTSSATLTHG